MDSISSRKPFKILIADDDEEDVLLAKESFKNADVCVEVDNVEDGQYLMDYLKHEGKYKEESELPQLILLDINMPRKNGFEALKEIKESRDLCRIPVVILSTSKTKKDIDKAYGLGANCYVSKPSKIKEWTNTMGQLGKFWSEYVVLS